MFSYHASLAIHNKHSIPESTNVHSQLKRTRLATEPPSSLAEQQNYESLQQDPLERILDDRPTPDLSIPPIPLLYHGFGHFLDIIGCIDVDIPGLADIKVAELRTAVDRLATGMAQVFDTEEDQREQGLNCLREIFAARQGVKIPWISPTAIGSICSDGHNITKDGTSSIIVMFKKSHTGISLPQVELAGYFAHLNARLNPELYRQWRVPCLGVTIVGELYFLDIKAF